MFSLRSDFYCYISWCGVYRCGMSKYGNEVIKMDANRRYGNRLMQLRMNSLLRDLDKIEKELDKNKQRFDDLYDKARSLVRRRIGEISNEFE